jgi:hypothetical protein
MSTLSWREAMLTVEKLSLADQLYLVSEVLQRVRLTVVEDKPIDLLTLTGVGAEVWAKVDTDDYLNQERDSWQ